MNNQKGFTLVEAAVAIGVVAILSGIIIPLVLKSIRDSQIARAKNDLQVIAAAIASQLKDTGRRPMAAAGPGGATGVAQALWYSMGAAPEPAAGGIPLFLAAGVNRFENLFGAPDNVAQSTRAQGNVLFGYPDNLPVNVEFGYKGPYLGHDMSTKTDPWGSAYLILGYNQAGQTSDSPIWVVSAGPGKSILAANVTPVGGAAGRYPDRWDYGTVSRTNIAVRVH